MTDGFGQTARLVGLRLGQTGGLDHIGRGETFGLGGRGSAGGFCFELEFGGVGQSLDPVTFGIGRLLHVGFQFALFAQDFLLLQLDLLLFVNDTDLHLLGLDQLAGLEFLQIVSQVRLRFLLIDGGLEAGDVGLVIALRSRDLGVGEEFRLLSGLRGLRRADHGVAVGFGLGDDGVALDLGDARFAEGVEVALAVADVADGETDDAQAHVGHVAGGDFLDFGGEASRFW